VIDRNTSADAVGVGMPNVAPADASSGSEPVAPAYRDDGVTPALMVDAGTFSGPLDLLLALIREEQLDIYDIPIARICEQFLRRIHALRLNDAADYLEMAARLLRIKAQMLLPRTDGGEQWEDPRAELVRRLLEYQQMREVVDVLERRGELRRNQFARSYVPASLLPPQPTALSLSLSELLGAVDRILRSVREPTMHEVVARPLDVPAAILTIRAVLALRTHARWSDLVEIDAEPWQILSTLLGILELAKMGELRVSQHKPFASVHIVRDVAGEAA
jgi:segregation and condensation protein A